MMFAFIPMAIGALCASQLQSQPVEPSVQSSALEEWLSSSSRDWDSNVARRQTPQFGINSDMFVAFTEKADAFNQFNRLRLRSLVFNAYQNFDFGSVAARFAVGDYDDFDEIIVPELKVTISDIGLGLPGNTQLQVGRFFADVGAFNDQLPSAFAAPHLDLTRRSYLGGNLSLLGLELRNDTDTSFGNFHFSLALASERQAVDFDNFSTTSTTGSNDDQRFSARNWLATSRASLQFDMSTNSFMRLGASAIVSPTEVVFTDIGAIEPERGEIEHNTFGAELGFLFNTKPNRSHELAFELWADDRQFREAANSYPYSLSRGEWAMYQFVYDSNWSLGAIGSRCDVLGLTVIDDDASHHSAFVSYQPSFGGNVSMFGTHTNPGIGQEKYFTFGMAYSLNLGRSPMPLGQRWY